MEHSYFYPGCSRHPVTCCCKIYSLQKIAGNETLSFAMRAVLLFYETADPAHNHHVNNQFNRICHVISPAPVPIYLHPVKILTALIIYLYPGLMTKRNTAP